MSNLVNGVGRLSFLLEWKKQTNKQTNKQANKYWESVASAK